MDKFTFADDLPPVVTKKIRRMIQKGPMAKVVTFDEKDGDLLITFSQFGTSKIWYNIATQESGFTATKKKEKVLFTHKVFRGEVEKYLKDIMTRIGAQFH